jgi:hypothetical protein
MDKWDYMKLKIFCTTKQMVSKLKRPPTECYIRQRTDNQNTEGVQITNPPINEPIKKWATEINRTFSKDEI